MKSFPGDSAHNFATLLHDLKHAKHIPVMGLASALAQLQQIEPATLAALRAEDPALLGRRCTELVTRGVLTHEQLARALALMAGLPGVDQIDPRTAPRAFLNLLLRDRERDRDRDHDHAHSRVVPARFDHPARNLKELEAALAQGRSIVTLRQAIEELRLMGPATLDRLIAQDPRILREHQAQLVHRALLTPDELGRALGRAAGLPEVDARKFKIPPEAFGVLPAATARTYDVLPLGSWGDVFFVASGTPTNEGLRHTLCGVTGHNVLMVWAEGAAIGARLTEIEQGVVQPETVEWKPVLLPEQRIDPEERDIAVPDLVAQAESEIEAAFDQEPAAAVGESSGMAKLVKRMVVDARERGASDIHVESTATGDGTLVRMRIDGDLQTYLTLPARLRAPLVSRIKIMARLDISERRRPQDGKINFTEYGGGRLELRVAVLPTHDGLENVVLRLLGTTDPLPLERLGLQRRDEETVSRLVMHSFGLILAVGPTGSGKTTTLHSLLMKINTSERKIWTAEDPIEITQPGLNQVQVNPKIGVTFAAALRSFLRADPDVIMIGEVRDEETAKIAIEASLTGHLVLSTLHTNNAAESVVRLLDLGLEPHNFADSLLGVVAQRLVRALCGRCAVREPLDAARFEELVTEYIGPGSLTREQARERLLAAAGATAPEHVGVGVARGCVHCGGKGYKGRMGIYEILENTPSLRELIHRHAPSSEVAEAAQRAGMRSLRHDALEKAVAGRIDLLQARTVYI